MNIISNGMFLLPYITILVMIILVNSKDIYIFCKKNNVEKKADFMAPFIKGEVILDMGCDAGNKWAWDNKTLHMHLFDRVGKKILGVDL
jgi:hypothetical protein